MREERIMRALGDVDDRYILEAAPVRNNVKYVLWKKLVYIAASIVLLVSLSAVAYAANWFGVRDLLLPFINRSNSTEMKKNDRIGLSGYQGSAEWQALAEWQEFLEQYDPNGIIYQNTDERLDSSFARYSCYRVYSKEMADQMDLITEKYELKLHTTSFDLQEYPELVETFGNFLGNNGGYYTYMYEDGTFEVEGTIQYADIGAWDYKLLRSVRGTFHDAMLDIGDISEYQETMYETDCGIPVTLALGRDRVLIFADLTDSFVTVTIPYGTDAGIEQSHLQILADSIDFTVLTPVVPPQKKDMDSQSLKVEQDMATRDVYAATLRNLLYSNILPDGSIAELQVGAYSQFAVLDVDSDGKEELVLLYDPGVIAAARGYIIGYDKNIEEIYIQLEEFPAFIFLNNGNLKALSSHNQTYGDMWPYTFYRYFPESDTYELTGYVHSEDKRILELNGMADQYPDETDISGAGTVYYVGSDGWGINPIDELDYMDWLKVNHGDAQELEIQFLPLIEENIEAIEHTDAEQQTQTWQSAYLEILYHLQDYLAPLYHPDGANTRSNIDPLDVPIYLGLHDFDEDGTLELIIGDTVTMAVFTYKDNQVEKIADLYYPDSTWCINGVFFKNHSISLACNGAGGSDFVNFGYLDGKYALGLYSQLNMPSVVTINGEESSLEEMNRIYTLNYEQRSEEERRARLRLVKENENWILKYPSGEEVVLDSNFDFDAILW